MNVLEACAGFRLTGKLLLTAVLSLSGVSVGADTLISDAKAVALVQGALDQWRGMSSYAEVSMTIHRPEWQRSMSLNSWTRGDKDALIRFTAPPKEAGNATLKLNNDMWIFAPKLNQVIKLPTSMMTQSWMGSDFSYNDLAKSDHLLTEFTLQLLGSEPMGEHVQHFIKATPRPDAPVVWGKEVLAIREDHILLYEQFYDQEMQLVKEMKTLEIAPLGGRQYPVRMRMVNYAEPGHWTEIATRQAFFDLALPGFMFTQSNLRNPRPWRPD
ncbi:outer membrane lipoprotein-sorting protein [Shewanella sp. AS16]|uniref:outer membrane lipoprotein-sorting protein n=1 Tax=Shewanella sp. AS16 TaxID=2907625 RepID=UPI001F452945|nr:outer membrane lipoprotein-sorting protein [Shewanella sp. AS16]MCE9685036.1 outer membrane lipoprotein-sorting protein [Shewanella sp. AS16]